MLTISMETGEVAIADNAPALIVTKGDVFPLRVFFTKEGALIAPPSDLVLLTALCTEGSRGGNGSLANATTFASEEAGIGAAVVSLPLDGSQVTAAFAGGGEELSAELQFKFTHDGFTRHSAFVPARLLNSLFA